MQHTLLFMFILSSSLVHSQKHAIDLSVLISHYSDVGGQNTNTSGNNVLLYTSYSSLDYRLSYYYNTSEINFWAFELEGSRRTLPANQSATIQLLNESYGLAMAGPGRMFKIDQLRIRLLSGFSFMINDINDADNLDQKHWFLSSGISFGSDLIYVPSKREHRYWKNLYFKTGFRGSLEFININLNQKSQHKPRNGITSILFGTGLMF